MSSRDGLVAAALVLGAFIVFNANGREIPSYDSQPTKYAARELLLRGTLGLNHVVGRVPELAERSGFQFARDGRFRSAYSPVPSIAAAAITWPFWKAGLIDIRAPLAPSLMAALAASALAAISTGLVFFIGRRWLSVGRAVLLGAGFAFGTGMWNMVSQTLWQHETAVFGLTLAMLAFTRAELRTSHAIAIGVGLALAGTARMQLAPAILFVLAGIVVRAGWRPAAMASAIVALGAAALIRVYLLWFGSPLGAAPMLEALHETVHGVSYSFGLSAAGLAGLLISPSRGLLVFSPLLLVVLGSGGALWRHGWRGPLRWCALAALAQYLFYGSYAVWWGGHTYGPRYMVDVLPLLVPLAAVGLAALRGRTARTLGTVALAWSVVAAATGAFCFPHERWNTDPANVDRHHERLWEWSDPQIVRCWQRGPSPQNFSLFDRAAWQAQPIEHLGP